SSGRLRRNPPASCSGKRLALRSARVGGVGASREFRVRVRDDERAAELLTHLLVGDVLALVFAARRRLHELFAELLREIVLRSRALHERGGVPRVVVTAERAELSRVARIEVPRRVTTTNDRLLLRRRALGRRAFRRRPLLRTRRRLRLCDRSLRRRLGFRR